MFAARYVRNVTGSLPDSPSSDHQNGILLRGRRLYAFQGATVSLPRCQRCANKLLDTFERHLFRMQSSFQRSENAVHRPIGVELFKERACLPFFSLQPFQHQQKCRRGFEYQGCLRPVTSLVSGNPVAEVVYGEFWRESVHLKSSGKLCRVILQAFRNDVVYGAKFIVERLRTPKTVAVMSRPNRPSLRFGECMFPRHEAIVNLSLSMQADRREEVCGGRLQRSCPVLI